MAAEEAFEQVESKNQSLKVYYYLTCKYFCNPLLILTVMPLVSFSHQYLTRSVYFCDYAKQ